MKVEGQKRKSNIFGLSLHFSYACLLQVRTCVSQKNQFFVYQTLTTNRFAAH